MDRIVITGGHHSSALPVIEELKRRFPKLEISWFGHKHSLAGSSNPSLEFKEISGMDIPFYELKAGKFYKTYNPIRILKIPCGFVQAFFLLKKLRPEAILSFGGYIAVPVVISAWILRIPSVSHEQTVVTGYANRLISVFAKKVLYTWPQSLKYLPKNKSIMTGLPLREEIFQHNKKEFNIENRKPTILITAGKSGSHIINTAVLKILEDLLKIANVIHQTGDHSKYNDFAKLEAEYDKFKTKVEGSYYLRKFIYSDSIGDAFNAADLIISRAGAHTCYEIMHLGKPGILVPIPWASHNEQNKNAEVVKDLGLVEVVPEDKIKDEKYFLEVIKEVLENRKQYTYKKPFEKSLNSARLIVDEVVKVI